MRKNNSAQYTTPVGADSTVKVRRGHLDSVTVYDVSEWELDQLEIGTDATVQLNFAIFFLSSAITSIVSLATANFVNRKIETSFIVAAFGGLALGAYFLIMWFRKRKSTEKIIKAIRSRVEPENDAKQIDVAVKIDTAIETKGE